MVAFITTLSFSLTSCGDDDDDEPSASGQQIEINGVKYNLSSYFQMYGFWTDMAELYGDEYKSESFVSLPIFVDIGNAIDNYFFMWKSVKEPQVGDDLTKKTDFTLTPYLDDTSVKEVDYNYSSGSAKIVSTNKSKNESEQEITIQFVNLKMVHGGNSFTFNGTVTLPFTFETTK